MRKICIALILEIVMIIIFVIGLIFINDSLNYSWNNLDYYTNNASTIKIGYDDQITTFYTYSHLIIGTIISLISGIAAIVNYYLIMRKL